MGGCTISNRFYTILLKDDGQIHSWKDKRTKNFERELCREGNQLNKICVHQNVPFFWDAWDIFHHDYETVQEYKSEEKAILQQCGSKFVIQFKYKLSSLSTLT
mmetsp:Transcript_149/g.164  ORF Transcript_149/g.164 Transcript_149/m.164 type:complete len:103 (+) Transcript_149:474-782(+)